MLQNTPKLRYVDGSRNLDLLSNGAPNLLTFQDKFNFKPLIISVIESNILNLFFMKNNCNGQRIVQWPVKVLSLPVLCSKPPEEICENKSILDRGSESALFRPFIIKSKTSSLINAM